jgi:uncharacterized protein
MEIRSIIAELRATEPRKIGGHAVLWNQPSRDLPFEEQFTRGAFLESLGDNSRDVVMLWSHDLSKPMANQKSGSLMVAEDDAGLAFAATLNQTSWSTDGYEAIRSGTVRTVSFRFSVPPGGDKWQQKGPKLMRTVHKAILLEISPTPLAAYPSTDVSVRSAAEIMAAARLDSGITVRDLLAQAVQLERMY